MHHAVDENGTLVFDLGHHSLRVGYAQDEIPKAEIPSFVGIGEGDKQLDNNITQPNLKYYVDTTQLHAPREGIEVVSYMKDGMIENWDHFEQVLDYSYAKIIQSDAKYHPVLFSESPWNFRNKREQLTELMFEKYDVPAYFLVKNAVLAAFANGKATGVVIDSGSTHTSSVPVQDGFVLKHAMATTSLGGDYISMECRQFLHERDIDLSPSYMIGSKEVVGDHDKPRWVKKKNIPEVTASWHHYMVKKLVQDFQATCLQISDVPYDERLLASVPVAPYEFPTGYRHDFGTERFLLPEVLFDPNIIQMRGGRLDHTMLGVGHIFATSVGACDVNLRPALCGNVILTGGNSLMQGYADRLNRDLSMRTPFHLRLKLTIPEGNAERRFASWFGGSILASTDTFQPMWISKHDYAEGGKSLVENKCP